MTHCKIKLLILALILLITGCTKKEEYTRPIRIHLNIGAITTAGPSNGIFSFEFSGAQIGIQRIQFEGIREAGGDVFFETHPEMNLPTIELTKLTNEYALITDLDIPQGVFHTFNWDINLKNILTDELTSSDDIDLVNAGLIIRGNYYHIWWGTENYGDIDSLISIPFIFAVEDTELFSFKTTSSGNSNIVLYDNKDYYVFLILNIGYAFDAIKNESFEELETSGNSLHPIVIISRNHNVQQYEAVLYRLGMSTKVRLIE